MSLSLDWETRSTINLPATGPYVYAQHATTDIWLGAWMFDDMDEPEVWYAHRLLQEHDPIPVIAEDDVVLMCKHCHQTEYDFTEQCPVVHDAGPDPVPQRIIDHIKSGGEVRAHNAAFERLIWKHIATPRYRWPEVQLEQFVCTAAEAAAMSLPRSLDQAAAVTGIPEQKDGEGADLMRRMSRPRRIEDDGTIVWWEEPERLARLALYCQQDVRTERGLARVLRRLDKSEREVYLLTERMNDRGLQLDTALIAAAKDVVAVGLDQANRDLIEITGGAVTSVTKVAEIKNWLATQAVETDSVSKARVRELLDEDIPNAARQVLELRSTAGRSSVAKIESMETCACDDGRVRGLLLYHGAGTGRWSGKLVQPHNFPRGEIKNIESFVPFVMNRDYEVLDMMYPPIVVVSSMLRSMLTASPGKELIVADYSAIEARFLNWIAGQQDMVELFRKYDAAAKEDKPNFDPYRVNAARLYNIPLTEVLAFPHRQTGKFQELGCGFGMGWKKAVNAAKTVYGLEISEERSKEIVYNYRDTHLAVVDYWSLVNEASIDAVNNPGKPVIVHAGGAKVTFVKAGAYLYIILPSGRPLVYPDPKVELQDTPWGDQRWGVSFWGVNPVTRKWSKQRLYGGLITENIVQAGSRDLLAFGLLNAEKHGYTPIMSVHDEAISEVPEGFGSVEEYEKIVSTTPEWAHGCPVSAEGWRGFRYRK